jgi:hypothetical protein
MYKSALIVISSAIVWAYMPPQPYFQQQPQQYYPQQYQPPMMPQPYLYEPVVNPFSKRNIGRYLKHKMLKPFQPMLHHLTDPYYHSHHYPSHHQHSSYYNEYYPEEEWDEYGDLYHKMQKKQYKAERKIHKINEMMQMMMMMSMNPNVNRGELYKLMMYSMAPKDMRRMMELTMMNSPSPYNQSPFMSSQMGMNPQCGMNSFNNNPFGFGGNMGMGQSPYPLPFQAPYNPYGSSPYQMNNPYQGGIPYFASLPQMQQQQLFNQWYTPSLNQAFNSPLGPYQVPGCSPNQLQSLGFMGSNPYGGNLNITDTNSTCLPYLLQYMRDRDMRRRLRALEEFDNDDYSYQQRPGLLGRLLGGGGGGFGSRPFMGSRGGFGGGLFGGSSWGGSGDFNMLRPRCTPQSDYQFQQAQQQHQMQMQLMQQQLAQQQAMIQQMNQQQYQPSPVSPQPSSRYLPPWRRR